jgi:tRNA threonylcarbamoyladenosine biosynthesis protein TsaB
MSALMLALDSATELASVALHDGERVLSETTWLAGREHSTRLLMEVERALARINRPARDVTGLVVTTGPGSFTGVRVAIGVAKGIAAGLGVPLWGVTALDVLSVSVAPRYATLRYVAGKPEGAIASANLEELVALVQPDELLVGDVPLDPGLLGKSVSPSVSLRRAGHLAELGWAAFRAGVPSDPADVDAIYLRSSHDVL